MKLKILVCCLLGMFLVGILGACSQTPQPQSNTEQSNYEIAPDGLSLSVANTPKLFVNLAISRSSSTERLGKVGIRWTDTASTLSGTADIRLRSVGSSTTLVESLGATVSSSGTGIVLSTPGTTVKGPLCVEVTNWNLSAGSYSFNNQSFPLIFCSANTSETGVDMKVALDGHSQTSVNLTQTFNFIISTQNLGKQAANDVAVSISLPSELEFVSDESVAYDCTEPTTGSITCVLAGNMKPGLRSLPLTLKGKTLTAGADVSVSISTTSTDSNSSNNSFTQAISVTNVCGAALFPDANLRNSVKSALSITNDADLCIDDMGGLTGLGAYDSNISNITGLEFATNLTQLYLGGGHTGPQGNSNRISDISALAGLTNLTYLGLDGNQQISDISALVSNSGLGSGDVVGLTYNSLDLTVGSDDWLNILTLQERGVTVSPSVSNVCGAALFPDANLRNAVKTTLSITNDADLCINGMGGLTFLIASLSTISDLTGLEYATNLTNLDLLFNQITDISALVSNSGLGSGDVIYLDFNPLSTQAISNIALLQGRGAFVTY